tara:strand:+ start:1231 stop:1566 length:336 start_codon:yes stop_codon:yes gene_type:complete
MANLVKDEVAGSVKTAKARVKVILGSDEVMLSNHKIVVAGSERVEIDGATNTLYRVLLEIGVTRTIGDIEVKGTDFKEAYSNVKWSPGEHRVNLRVRPSDRGTLKYWITVY